MIPELIKNGQVRHAYLGITSVAVPAQLARDLNLPTDKGALIQSVAPGSPADKAGLRAGSTPTAAQLIAGGDLIVAVDGTPVANPTDISAAIADRKPGDKVTVEFMRGQTKKSVVVTLGNRPNTSAGAQPTSP